MVGWLVMAFSVTPSLWALRLPVDARRPWRRFGFVLFVLGVTLSVADVGLIKDREWPLLADVRLGAPFAATTDVVGTNTARAGYSYLVVRATVESRNFARGVRAASGYSLRADGRTYEPARASWEFEGHCGSPGIVPLGGSVSCPLVFEIPDSVHTAVLRFRDVDVGDRVVLPAFGPARIPFAPNVELALASVGVVEQLNGVRSGPGTAFLVLDVRVHGKNLASDPPYLSVLDLRLSSREHSYRPSSWTNRLPGSCGVLESMLQEADNACAVAFEVPEGFREGVLRLERAGYADEVAFALCVGPRRPCVSLP
ncbi:MAG TPA: hypothetical protein VF171_00505 [Trueperaceae bacterium]